MTTATNGTDKMMVYTPAGENAPVKLSAAIVRDYLTTPTRSGVYPTTADITKFMMLCQARELNPWVGDAYLVGYDSRDGAVFNLITAVQALHKRSELNKQYDGMESGVIVIAQGNTIVERPGCFLIPGERLVGSWAKAYRKDRSVPVYASLSRIARDTGKSRWAADPAGMLVKCAEAEVLRKAFPNQVSALYISEEMDSAADAKDVTPSRIGEYKATNAPSAPKTRSDSLADKLASPPRAEAQEPGPHPPEDDETEPPPKTEKPKPKRKRSKPKPPEPEPQADDDAEDFPGEDPNYPAEGEGEDERLPEDSEEHAPPGSKFGPEDEPESDEPTAAEWYISRLENAAESGDPQQVSATYVEAQQYKLAGRISDEEWKSVAAKKAEIDQASAAKRRGKR